MSKNTFYRLSFWHQGTARRVARLCSLGLVLALLWPNLLWAFEPGGVFPQARIPIPAPLAAFDLPESLGSITETFQGGDRLVVCIQDLHCNYEAQTKIGHILDQLAEKSALRLVAVEGATGTVDVSRLAKFPLARVKNAVAEYLMRQGRITGTESYAALGRHAVDLEGAENPGTYEAAWKVLPAFFSDETQGLISDLRDELEAAKEKVYSPELFKHDRRRRSFREGRLPLLSYAVFLHQSASRLGLETAAFPELAGYISKRGNVLPRPADSEVLHRELDQAEQQIRGRLFSRDEERALDSLEERLDTLERLLNISATAQDLENIRRNPQAYQAGTWARFFQRYPGSTESVLAGEEERLDGWVEQALVFYRLADLRSQALADNTLALMAGHKTTQAVLVTGGFHTAGILSRLKQQGVSYVCVRPRITREDWVNPYFSILRNQRMPLEKWLSQNQNILAPRLNFSVASPLFAKVLNALFEQVTVLDGRLEGARTLQALENRTQEKLAAYPWHDPALALDWRHALAQVEENFYYIPVRAGGALVVRRADAPLSGEVVERLELGGYEAALVQDPKVLAGLRKELENGPGVISGAGVLGALALSPLAGWVAGLSAASSGLVSGQESSERGFTAMLRWGLAGALASGMAKGIIATLAAFGAPLEIWQWLGSGFLGLSLWAAGYALIKGLYIANAFSDKPKTAKLIDGLQPFKSFDPERITVAEGKRHARPLDVVSPAGEIRIARQVKFLPAFFQCTVWAHALLHRKFPWLPEPVIYVLEFFAGAGLWLAQPIQARPPTRAQRQAAGAETSDAIFLESVATASQLALEKAALSAQDAGLLAPHFIEYARALLQQVNPEAGPLTAAYGASGPDVSSLLLSTNFSTAYLLDAAPMSLQKLRSHLNDRLEKHSPYFSAKYKQGFSYMQDFQGQSEKYLVQELLALGVKPGSMRADLDEEGKLFLEFTLPGDIRPRTLFLVEHNLLESEKGLNQSLGGKIDVYYQKAAMDVQREVNAFKHWKDIRAWLRPGALILLNEYDAPGNQVRFQEEFYGSFLNITSDTLKRMADRIVDKVPYAKRYGWEMSVWRSKFYQPLEAGGPVLVDLQRALKNLARAGGQEELYQQLVNGVMDVLRVRAVNVYSVDTQKGVIEYQSKARAGMRHPTGADIVRTITAGNEKHFLFGPELEASQPGIYKKENDLLHIQKRHLASFVNKKDLLRDIVAYSGLPRFLKDGLQPWIMSAWFPHRIAALLVNVLAVAAPKTVARVDEALWMVLRDPSGVPQGLLFINNWDNGRPLLAGADQQTRLALLPVITRQAWAALEYQQETQKLKADIGEIQTAVNQINGSFGGRLVSQDMRDTIHNLKGSFVTFAFLPRLIKKLKPLEGAVEQLQTIFNTLGTNQSQINELLDGVRSADEAFRSTQEWQAKELERLLHELETRQTSGPFAGGEEAALLQASEALSLARTSEEALHAAQAALDRSGDREVLKKMVLALSENRFRQLLDAEDIRDKNEALSGALDKLKRFSLLFNFTGEMKQNILAIRKVLDSIDPGELASAGGEPVNFEGAIRDLKILEDIIHRVNIFEMTLDGVLKNRDQASAIIEVVPVLERVIAAARRVSPEATITFEAPAPEAQGALTARIDPAKMEFLLLNELITNALKYKANRVNLALVLQDGELVITVADNGVGMGAVRLAEVRTGLAKGETLAPDARVAEGVSKGIGFNQMNRVVQEAGGRLEVESTALLGTRVSVHLPQAVLAADEKLAQSAFQELSTALKSAEPARGIGALIADGKIFLAVPEMKNLAGLRGGVAWGSKNMLEFTQGLLATLGQLKTLAAAGDLANQHASLAWTDLQTTPIAGEVLHPAQVKGLVELYRRIAGHEDWESLLWIVAMTIMTGKTDAILPQDRFRLAAITARNIIRHYNQETKEKIPLELGEKIAGYYAMMGDYLMTEITPAEVGRILRRENFTEDELSLLTLLSVAVIKNVGERGKLSQTKLAAILNNFKSLAQVQKAAGSDQPAFADQRIKAWSAGEELPKPRSPIDAEARESALRLALAEAAPDDLGVFKSMTEFLNQALFYHSYFLFNALTPTSLAKMIYLTWQLQTGLKSRWVIFDTDALPAGLEKALADIAWAELKARAVQASQTLQAEGKVSLLGMEISRHEGQLVVRLKTGAAQSGAPTGKGTTLYSSVLPSLILVALFTGQVWVSLLLVLGVLLYHGMRWGYQYVSHLYNLGHWILVNTYSPETSNGHPFLNPSQYSQLDYNYFERMAEAFERETQARFGVLSSRMTPEEQLARIRQEADFQRGFVEAFHAQFSQKQPEDGKLARRATEDMLRFIDSVDAGTLGFTYVAVTGDPIPYGIKWLSKFFGREAPMHAMAGMEPGVFLHATGRKGLRRVTPVSALYVFLHNQGAVAVYRLPHAVTPEQKGLLRKFALEKINLPFNFQRFALGRAGKLFPGTICTDFVMDLTRYLDVKLKPKTQTFSLYAFLGAWGWLMLASPLALLVLFATNWNILGLAALAVFLGAYWNYDTVVTPFRLMQGSVDGQGLAPVFIPRKPNYTNLQLLGRFFMQRPYDKAWKDYFLPTTRKDLRIFLGVGVALFMVFFLRSAHMSPSDLKNLADVLSPFLDFFRLGSGYAESLSREASGSFMAPVVLGLGLVSSRTKILESAPQGTDHLRQPELETFAGEPSLEDRLQPGQTLRPQGTWLQRWALSWLRTVLFDGDPGQAGQYQNGLRLDGAVHFFKAAFFLLRGLAAGWILLGGRSGEPAALPDEAAQKLLQLQSADEVAFEVFAKYGQGGMGELALRSDLRGGFWVKVQSLLGWSETREEGRTLYFLPDGLLQKPASPWRNLMIRLMLEHQVGKVYSQNRPDLELAGAQSWMQTLGNRLQRAWLGLGNPERVLGKILAGDHSPLARALAAGDKTPAGRSLLAWMRNPGTTDWAWLAAARDILMQGTPAEQAANLATLSRIYEKVPGLKHSPWGTWQDGGAQPEGQAVFLPVAPALPGYRAVYRELLDWAGQIPAVAPDRRRWQQPVRPRILEDAA